MMISVIAGYSGGWRDVDQSCQKMH